MSFLTLLIIIALTLAIGLISHAQWRSWFLMLTSILAIYWMQPETPIRHLDFWLPTLSIILAILVWVITIPKDGNGYRSDLITGLVIAVVILLVGSTRYFNFCCLTPTRPPGIDQTLVLVVGFSLIVFLLVRFRSDHQGWIYVLSFIILGLFIVLKFEPFGKLASMGLRSANSQSVQLASGLDIRWLGFSYVAFRLLHMLKDRLSGKLPALHLQEYIIYILFYPSISAGPIDRVQHFVQNLHSPYHPSMENYLQGSKRIFIGIFRKFVLADGLALFALNADNASQIISTGWLWVILYAFAFRIYFDFSGYTDIALGLGSLVGIQLPENFDKPYFKQNLTQFWNSWHMTLAGWFRSYFFNPLTRSLRSSPRRISFPVIIFMGQLSTFVLIGLWHGITWNFAIWGAWHGLGLYIHNRWSEYQKAKGLSPDTSPGRKTFISIVSILFTFHYVSLGWVWFTLSTPDQAWKIFLRLFGVI